VTQVVAGTAGGEGLVLRVEAWAVRPRYRRFMSRFRAFRVEVAVAAFCVGWALFFARGEDVLASITAPLVVAPVVALRRWPVPAAAGLAALVALHQLLLRVPGENPWPLAALFVAVYALGRHATAARSGLPLAALLVAFVAADPSLPALLFGAILLGSVWMFGALVRRRTDAAERAASTAAQLSAIDPEQRAAEVVAEERAGLAGDALAVVRDAVTTMQRHARRAEDHLDLEALEAVQAEGRRATRELRRLLGLLRSEDETDPAPAPAARPRPGWRADLLTAAALGAAIVVEALISPGSAQPLAVVLAALLATAVVLRRVEPSVACAVAVGPPALALALDLELPYGVGTAAVVALLAWSAAGRGRPRDLAALGAFVIVLAIDGNLHHPGNTAMMLAFAGLAAIAGHLWTDREREERAARTTAANLEAQHEAVAEQAVRAERLRLARELHDVASHAVGVMVLQAAAAAALRGNDPDRAHDAIETVVIAGTQALSELEMLFGLLDAGAIGVAGRAAAAYEDDLGVRVEALSARMREAGLDVTTTVDQDRPDDPEVAATAYRIVQEALTNALRYAPEADVQVEIRSTGRMFTITVRDDGPHTGAGSPSGGGFGLVGLAERVRAHGGELTAGPAGEGGFVVAARLPVGHPTELAT
jgi:signal transduction histidine kinase